MARASSHFLSLCRDAARRGKWESEFVVTDKAQAGVDAARGAGVRGVDLVVAVGGDGTVRGCAEGLAGSPVPLGIVPLGTANLLARTLDIPLHPRAALGLALTGSPTGSRTGSRKGDTGSADRRIDLATADGAPFTAMAGMGLDAAVVSATRLKHHLGWLAYAASGAAHLTASPATFTIRLDNGKPFERRAQSVVVGNSGLLPGGFALLPGARVDDGLLDVGILAPHGPLGWPKVAARVLTNSRVEDRHLERLQAREIEIIAHRALPREVDGEVVTPGSALSVRVRRAALTVRVPTRRR
jgi:undecaprenyl-diphosphatase